MTEGLTAEAVYGEDGGHHLRAAEADAGLGNDARQSEEGEEGGGGDGN